MKLAAVIKKCLREQLRQFWILAITISMAPFFVGIFYLIYQSTSLNLKVAVVNLDISDPKDGLNYSRELIRTLEEVENDSIPIRFVPAVSRSEAEINLQGKSVHAILIIPSGFSDSVRLRQSGSAVRVPFEFSGNLTDPQYMIAAIMGVTYVSGFITSATGALEPYHFIETPAGISSQIDDFTLGVPGMLILATIMLMFSGAIAFVVEPEKKTMLRLKLSKVSPLTFLTGVTIVQILVGLVSILLTLGTAYLFGFHFRGSFWLFLLVGVLTSLSVIGFSLLLAGITKSVNEVLVVGNFPLFLFMFFSGTVFPIHGMTLFHLGSYDFTLPGLMSTYHGVDAMKQILIYEANLSSILPQIVSMLAMTGLYFLLGFWVYRRKHMRVF